MKIAIMQPYFLPYIGYWQLINSVDQFILLDDVNYINRGWINRNRILINGEAKFFNLPLLKKSQNMLINEIFLDRDTDRINKMKRSIDLAYRKAPYYESIKDEIDQTYECREDNLFLFLKYSIERIMDKLGMSTKILVSSDLDKEKKLNGEARVIDLCRRCGADDYINPIGGVDLYHGSHFMDNGIRLRFLKSRLTPYKQFDNEYIPALSIIDVLAFCGIEGTKKMLDDYDLIEP